METTIALELEEASRRRIGYRMTCLACDVCWTGAKSSTCWICEGPGFAGPPPSIYAEPEG